MATRSCSSASTSTSPRAPFVSIVGPSGCGKTHVPAPAARPGAARRGAAAARWRAASRPSRTPDRGIVFQRYSVFPHLTVLRQCAGRLEFGAAPAPRRGSSARRRRAAIETAPSDCIEAVGLAASRQISERALRRHAAAARDRAGARSDGREVLLLDEPFGALDPGTRAQMHALIKPLWREHRDDHRHGHPRHQGGLRPRHAPDRASTRCAATRRRRRRFGANDHLRSRL